MNLWPLNEFELKVTYIFTMSTKSLICYGVIGFIGVILIVVSMAGFAYFPALIESQIFKTLDITDHESEGYKNFVSSKIT